MTANVGMVDRVVRLVIGILLIAFALGYGWVLAWLLSVALRVIGRPRRR